MRKATSLAFKYLSRGDVEDLGAVLFAGFGLPSDFKSTSLPTQKSSLSFFSSPGAALGEDWHSSSFFLAVATLSSCYALKCFVRPPRGGVSYPTVILSGDLIPIGYI